MLTYLVVITIVAYLIGAIPVGVVIARINNVDITAQGSGKMGTTNVLRTVGKRAAAMVLVGDYLKGSLAVLMARVVAGAFAGSDGHVELLGFSVQVVTLASVLATVAAVSGHVWSIYLRVLQGKWRGGRGVATAQGAMLVVNPFILLVALLVGIPTILISRYVSLGSILGAGAAGIALILFVVTGQMDQLSLIFVLLAVFIIVAHRDNIERLLKGTERKIGDRARG